MLRIIIVIVVAWAVVMLQEMVIANYSLNTGQAMAMGILDGMFYTLGCLWAIWANCK